MIDVFLIGFLLNESAIANYKVAIILPMNLMFIPLIFMQTDYPKLVEQSKNKSYLLFYIRNYYKIFIPLSLLILLVGFLIKDNVLALVFGEEYQQNGWIFFTILVAVTFNMCFRNLYGNMLSAVGLANKNASVAIFSIILMFVLGTFFIHFYGVIGAALALSITFISMGFYSFLLFRNYLNQLSNA